MPTNEDRRYANKQEIDQAFEYLRWLIIYLEGLDFYSTYRVQEPETVPRRISDLPVVRKQVWEHFLFLQEEHTDFDRETNCLLENYRFAVAELPSFDWRGQRWGNVRLATSKATGVAMEWLSGILGRLSEEGVQKECSKTVAEIFDSFPIHEDDWHLLWDRWKLEYSRLLRDLGEIAKLRESHPEDKTTSSANGHAGVVSHSITPHAAGQPYHSMGQQNSPPECAISFKRFLGEIGRPMVQFTFGGGSPPIRGMDVICKLLTSRADALSMWLGIHASESVRREFDDLLARLKRECLRLERFHRWMCKVNEKDRNSARGLELIDGFTGLVEIELATVSNFMGNLGEVLNWDWNLKTQRSPTTTPTHPTGQTPLNPLELAKTWLDKSRKLGGPTTGQKTFVGVLIGHDGWESHADLSVKGEFDWEDPRKGATNMTKRINESIDGKELWSIIPEDNSGCRIVLNSDLEKRS